jgi:hypothetical protein
MSCAQFDQRRRRRFLFTFASTQLACRCALVRRGIAMKGISQLQVDRHDARVSSHRNLLQIRMTMPLSVSEKDTGAWKRDVNNGRAAWLSHWMTLILTAGDDRLSSASGSLGYAVSIA